MSLPLFDVGTIRSGARISEDGHYRYRLFRRWLDVGASAVFVMLNPSTADAMVDDPTIRRCVGFAKAWGYAGLWVVNLYAYRATKPADLWLTEDPVGPENDEHLRAVAEYAEWQDVPIVAAWGANAKAERVAEVLALPGMERLAALGVTKDGHPRHPLYMRGDATPQSWSQP